MRALVLTAAFAGKVQAEARVLIASLSPPARVEGSMSNLSAASVDEARKTDQRPKSIPFDRSEAVNISERDSLNEASRRQAFSSLGAVTGHNSVAIAWAGLNLACHKGPTEASLELLLEESSRSDCSKEQGEGFGRSEPVERLHRAVVFKEVWTVAFGKLNPLFAREAVGCQASYPSNRGPLSWSVEPLLGPGFEIRGESAARFRLLALSIVGGSRSLDKHRAKSPGIYCDEVKRFEVVECVA